MLLSLEDAADRQIEVRDGFEQARFGLDLVALRRSQVAFVKNHGVVIRDAELEFFCMASSDCCASRVASSAALNVGDALLNGDLGLTDGGRDGIFSNWTLTTA